MSKKGKGHKGEYCLYYLINRRHCHTLVSIEKRYAALTKSSIDFEFGRSKFPPIIDTGQSIHFLLVFTPKPYLNLF